MKLANFFLTIAFPFMLSLNFDYWHPQNYGGPTVLSQEPVVIHQPVYPSSYPQPYGQDHLMFQGLPLNYQPKRQVFKAEGQALGYPANSLYINGVTFPFQDMSGNSGKGTDFDHLNQALASNQVVKVGQHGMNSFFGHYYDLSNSGPFQPLVAQDLLHEGSQVILTDREGLSKCYEITQILNINVEEADHHFYGRYSIPELIYQGNQEDMIYIQYCRWDIELGMLISHFGYRIF
ncbi:hypothetical protein [Ignavigranum ruoffiae]|uniref:hypothetical protein n=1 Tax=Ignavigranum ruoffiae TaxID=89093 RepID=UPI0024ACA464|nr:hypothetical protein [Ignavigranum ruoffiae]